MRRTPLKSSLVRKPLRQRSKRTERLYVQRRAFVAEFLEEHPMCQRCKVTPSRDVHEPLTRARGGSITDPDNAFALCRDCHKWVHGNPAKATEQGWLRRRNGQPE